MSTFSSFFAKGTGASKSGAAVKIAGGYKAKLSAPVLPTDGETLTAALVRTVRAAADDVIRVSAPKLEQDDVTASNYRDYAPPVLGAALAAHYGIAADDADGATDASMGAGDSMTADAADGAVAQRGRRRKAAAVATDNGAAH